MDNRRIWAERLTGALMSGSRQISAHDEDLLAQARAYLDVPLARALWSLQHATGQWQEAVELALRDDVVLLHAGRSQQRADDVARNNAHDAHHHEWDIRRSVASSPTRR